MIQILAKLERLVWMVGDRETAPKIATRPTSREGCIVPHWDGAGRRTTVNSKQVGAFLGPSMRIATRLFRKWDLSAPSLSLSLSVYSGEQFSTFPAQFPGLRKNILCGSGSWAARSSHWAARSSQSISLCKSRDLWEQPAQVPIFKIWQFCCGLEDFFSWRSVFISAKSKKTLWTKHPDQLFRLKKKQQFIRSSM